jgi:hypothetical protein
MDPEAPMAASVSWKPMLLMINVRVDAGTVNLKAPDESVVVPPGTPFTRIVAPDTGSPVVALTT